MTKLRAWRWPLAALVVLLAGAFAAALAFGGNDGGTLDPDSASPDGGRALATLLRDRGVTVTPVRTTADVLTTVQAARSGATLLVTDPGLLTRFQLDTVAATPVARLVVVQPDPESTELLTTEAALVSPSPEGAKLVDPGCPDADARAAGNADIGDGEVFSGVPTGCYPLAGGDALVTTAGPASNDTVLVGSRTPFRNDGLADHGNAALALRLLGKHPTVVWYLPDEADPAAASGQKSFTDVLPAGWRWGALTMVLAIGLLALWQARRLGPVVSERMPVAVRAAETVEGRARLYERGRVTDRAAGALREATRARLAARLGLPRMAAAGDVAAAIAARGGPPTADALAVLAGPVPADDAGLVGLASALDRLEAEVGRL
ncbi:DUF4350 domain-containing protein [Catenulispora sp. NF23]|uniref:DUF4350 domain-containing protein n=1 Tax=Catenulispora pinistramenti TaxID=2705254 RepID=A0ABS5L0G2_9ACTN|nr:DUF4350 domain-containing protein [Catenulispora pinistramenti]MBS2534322.1 DUF4350 domain-containing protein [Catenulispora pinistramenti]MBS2551749.1 DUF4350 domain-containing protein [Catenulispora pinistramenti]